jgi:restriction endonuclease Mrr
MIHLHRHADLKLFVTTSEYTDRAQALAQLHGIQLMNGSDIENLAKKKRESTP